MRFGRFQVKLYPYDIVQAELVRYGHVQTKLYPYDIVQAELVRFVLFQAQLVPLHHPGRIARPSPLKDLHLHLLLP